MKAQCVKDIMIPIDRYAVVRDDVIGQIGHLDFLAALGPRYPWKHDVDAMTRAGVDPATLDSLMESQHFWQDNLDDACRRARAAKVADIMHPVSDSIDEMAPIAEAIRKIVMLRAMRMLVLRGGEAVGIVRLADLFAEIADRIEAIEE